MALSYCASMAFGSMVADPLAGAGAVSPSIAASEPIDTGKSVQHCGRALSSHPEWSPGGPAGGPRGTLGGTDVTHYALEIEILPELNEQHEVVAVAVHGTNTVDVTVVDAPLDSFVLDLVDEMNVLAVTEDVAGWSHAGDQIAITLDRTYNPGESFRVVVEYDGIPDVGGFGAFKWWLRNGNLAVATLSEPFYSPYWWPCKDSLSDKSTMQMIVTVPDPMVVVSNGILESTVSFGDSRTRYSWHEINPMVNYLASLAITNYELYEIEYEYDDGQGGTAMMPVSCYLYPDHWDPVAGEPLSAVKNGCDELLTMLSVFEDKLGPYAFRDEKYGVAETGGAAGLQSNMEHQTISSMYQMHNYSDIVAHELGHHWFGDDITCATWNDIWLNEGWASYLEALYREFKPSGGVGPYWARMNARRPNNPYAQVYRTNVSSVGAIFSTNDIYNKGAWVAHMLRHVMGDEAFFQAIMDYRAAYADGFATTADFTNVFSTSFGHDLTWFTDQWVMSPGAPDYTWGYTVEKVDGIDYVKLWVRQLQNLSGFGLVTMPIDVRVTTSQGATVHRIWNDGWTEHYVLPLDGQLAGVEFDESGGIDNRNYVLASSVAFDAAPLPGPPVVVEAVVAPYGAVPGESVVEVYFSDDIGSIDAGDVTLIGAATGAHAADLVSFDAFNLKATIVYAGLPNDAYTLTLSDAGIAANGLALDGEIDDSAWYDDVLLPSGDGQPGGDATITFATLAGDANCDQSVDPGDIAPFVAVLMGVDTDACHVLRGDANNDGAADGADISIFIDSVLNP